MPTPSVNRNRIRQTADAANLVLSGEHPDGWE
jgi:hypothetical protein